MGWLFGALGGAGHRAAQDVRPQGHPRPRPAGPRPHLREHPHARRQAGRRAGGRRSSSRPSTSSRSSSPRASAACGSFVQDQVGDLEEMVIGGIKDFIIEKVIKAGITWLIAFMNPAAAFIKACKAIYDIVMFLIERGSADHGVRQRGARLDRRGRQGQHRRDGGEDRGQRWPRRCRSRSRSWPACSASAASPRRSARSSRRSRRRSTRRSTSSC